MNQEFVPSKPGSIAPFKGNLIDRLTSVIKAASIHKDETKDTTKIHIQKAR